MTTTSQDIAEPQADTQSVDTAPAPSQDTTPSNEPSGIPNGLPEAFIKDGAVDLDAIKAAYESKTKFEERASQLPQDGNYTIELAEDLKDAEGKPIQIDTQSPAYLALAKAAKEIGLLPTEVNQIATDYVRAEFEAAKAEQETLLAEQQKELAKLGANPEVRIKAIADGFKAHLGDDDAKAFLLALPNSAAAVKASEKILAMLTSTSPNPVPVTSEASVLPNAQVFYGKK